MSKVLLNSKKYFCLTVVESNFLINVVMFSLPAFHFLSSSAFSEVTEMPHDRVIQFLLLIFNDL